MGRRVLFALALALLLCYGLALGLVALGQSRLVYLPGVQRELAATPADVGLAYQDVSLETADGERLGAWWVPHPTARGAVILFNGNAGNRSHRLGYARMLHDLGYACLLFDYRGFDASSGRPSEAGTALDGDAAWRFVTLTQGVEPRRVVLLGESLGSAVATELAARQAALGALVLASGFTSVPDLGAELYWYLPVRRLARIHYPTVDRLPQVRAPVLIAHSPQDELVPFAHAQRLYAAAPEPKTLLVLAGGHNDGFLHSRPEWGQALGRFLAEALPAD